MREIVKRLPAWLDLYSGFFVACIMVGLLSFNTTLRPRFTSYAEDFRWRKALISDYISFRFYLGDRVFNQTLVGKDGWLFFSAEQSVDDYQNLAVIRPLKLARLQRGLDRLNAELKDKGIHLLVVIPPSKSTIYPQYMPDGIPVTGQSSRLDQFLTYMRDNGKTPILDLRPALLAASRNQQVYFKTDTHWNDNGVFVAYQAIMQTLVTTNPALVPHDLSAYDYVYAGDFVRDLPPLMGLPDYKEATSVLVPKEERQMKITSISMPDGRSIRLAENEDAQLPRLLVFGDSFYESLAPFVEQHFSHTTYIPFTYDSDTWSLNWIDKEQPEYVIIEITERHIELCLLRLLGY